MHDVRKWHTASGPVRRGQHRGVRWVTEREEEVAPSIRRKAEEPMRKVVVVNGRQAARGMKVLPLHTPTVQ